MNLKKPLPGILAFVCMFIVWGTSETLAQKLSLTANVSKFNVDKIQSEAADIDYAGSTSMDLNLRVFTKNKWAFRVGAGLDRLDYTVAGTQIATDYEARRNDLKGILGVEKHFMLANWIDVYPGVYVPITVTGQDVIDANFDNIKNGDMTAGLGVVLGANVGFLKVIRLGVEFDATFNNFKTQVWESAEQLSLVPLKGIKTNTSFTVGVML